MLATNTFLQGPFAPVTDEITAFDLPVTGSIPAGLSGRYLRNGPNPMGLDDPGYLCAPAAPAISAGHCPADTPPTPSSIPAPGNCTPSPTTGPGTTSSTSSSAPPAK
jgi:hypothetical protein